MPLLKQHITKKKRINKNVKEINFDTSNNDSRKYKIKAIKDRAIYVKESESDHLPKVYHLIF